MVDLADGDAIESLVRDVLARFGRIDILVNSAGMSGAPHNVLDFTDEKFELVTAVNLRAPFFLHARGRQPHGGARAAAAAS